MSTRWNNGDGMTLSSSGGRAGGLPSGKALWPDYGLVDRRGELGGERLGLLLRLQFTMTLSWIAEQRHLIGMNKYHFRKFLFGFIFSSVLLCFGCGPLTNEKVVGKYERRSAGVADSIYFRMGGTFEQVIFYTNSMKWSINGFWKINNRAIELDKCYLTFDDEGQTNIIPPMAVYSCVFILRGDNQSINFDGRLLFHVQPRPSATDAPARSRTLSPSGRDRDTHECFIGLSKILCGLCVLCG